MLVKFNQWQVHKGELDIVSYVVGSSATVTLRNVAPPLLMGEHIYIYLPQGNIQGFLYDIVPACPEDGAVLLIRNTTCQWREQDAT